MVAARWPVGASAGYRRLPPVIRSSFVLAIVTLYTVLKTLHVLAAVTWVGGSIVLQILAVRVKRDDDPAELARWRGTSSS